MQAADGSVAGRFEPFEGLRGKPFPYASLAVAGPYLYVAAAKKAEVAVWRHGPSPSVVAVNDGLGSSLNSSPFFAGKRLFLRTEDELICIGEP